MRRRGCLFVDAQCHPCATWLNLTVRPRATGWQQASVGFHLDTCAGSGKSSTRGREGREGGIRRQAEWTKAARWVGGRLNGAVGVGDSTYAAGDGAVPLRQRVGDRQTLDGARSLQHVTRTALEADHSAHGKVVAHAPAVPRLRDGAALSGARLGYSFG